MPDRPGSRKLITQFREEYYTAAEVAAIFGIGMSAVAVWRRTGKITGTELPGGRRYMYSRAGIDALAAARCPPQQEAAGLLGPGVARLGTPGDAAGLAGGGCGGCDRGVRLPGPGVC